MSREVNPLFVESQDLLAAAQHLLSTDRPYDPQPDHAMVVARAAARLAVDVATASKDDPTKYALRFSYLTHAIHCWQFIGDTKKVVELCDLFLTWNVSAKLEEYLRHARAIAASRSIEDVIKDVVKDFDTGHPRVAITTVHHNWIKRSCHEIRLVINNDEATVTATYTLVIADVTSSASNHYPCRLQWMFRDSAMTIDTSQKLEEALRRFLSSDRLKQQLAQLKKNADAR